ncbi:MULTISPECIES: alpha/beta fold hydrolase [unclassified Beijerinckia]|uniref:serine aminopeptidase domain-containing protein n=1 Tax=unclassified Beijerinckia TaxID=2638183 RepID=UPI00089D0B85|nr:MULTISPECIES: alpha/beta fold hydrolase [unclassified Beijerinckia]MDH7794795.1 dienelactone hydrolase [Beijerinckia sp. GAS462]SEB75517.1 Pimeloyl-ACP methyl ester carboxylesterase [Beijerinckia sp. 28-YEA-48]
MVPVSFEGCAGSFHPARGTRGVVICSSFGFEEICARKSLVLLAHKLAARGINVLRFDYFGTGDALGGPLHPHQVESWISNIRAAAAWLKTNAAVSDISLIGLRLGALLAANAAPSIEQLSQLVLIAPPLSGKAWLRETQAFSAMIAPPLGEPTAPSATSEITLAGYRMTSETAAALKALTWPSFETASTPLLILSREQTQEAQALAQRAGGPSDKVEVLPFAGYGAMMCDPTASEPPIPTLTLIADHLPHGNALRESGPANPPCLPLVGADFVETPVQIGADGHVNGIFCRPPGGEQRRNIIVFFNAGGIPRSGWGRMHVDLARKLARFGTSSLRIDLPGLADSAWPGGPSAVAVISQDLSARISTIIDWLKERGFAEISLAGACSGAYHAFRTALADPRIDRLVLLNQGSFVWSATHAMKLAAWQKSKAREMQTKLSALDSDEQAASDAAKLMARLFPLAKRFARSSLDAMMALSARANHVLAQQNPVEAAFHTIAGRGTKIMLVYSENDAGLTELERHMGLYLDGDGMDADALPGVSKHILKNADHMLTQPWAREEFGDLVCRFVDQRSTVRTEAMERAFRAGRVA